MTIERATYVYFVVGVAILVALVWWEPSGWIAMPLGAGFVITGVVLVVKLDRRRRQLIRDYRQ